MSTQDQIIEHIVLFNVKPDVDPTKVAAMIDGLNRMASLDLSIHVSAGELLSRSRSDSDSLTFSHIMHTRFTSNDNLQVYYTHPEHLRMVSENIHPIIDDIMIVDWISNNISHEAPKPGSVMRVTLLKLKEDLLENEKSKFFEMMEGIKNQFKAIEQVSFGENFHAMAKGYSISSIVVFSGFSYLEAFDSDAGIVNSIKEKVKDSVETELVVDYMIPLPKVSDD
ncbi:unnamed protein product [Lactuca virosa]|uniref:Stress-response A/B barrel domain-containing protein n=1 Tax=Lactuca virosa TaxID=75947 RepID=A0AAU9MI42_9ASTR|nr:unnamed protein product [Lactuca virosa]